MAPPPQLSHVNKQTKNENMKKITGFHVVADCDTRDEQAGDDCGPVPLQPTDSPGHPGRLPGIYCRVPQEISLHLKRNENCKTETKKAI